MKTKPLGRLEKVDLREYWKREDTHFTPWLAQEENITLLGETIGMELEVQGQEANVGPFRADVLCRNTADDTLVLIENQLERTDHGHLGQLITYAAGLDAVTLVWVVQRFTEEHRAALDWLNRITEDNFLFFGLEIELWRIGESVPAPKFNLVVKPNEWSKTVRDAARSPGGLSEGQQAQVEYWTSFGAFLEDQGARFKPPKPYPSNWMGWGLGRSGVSLLAIANKAEVMVGFDVHNARNSSWFPQLHERKEEIEAELGFEMEWQPKPGARISQCRVRRAQGTKDTKKWPNVHKWMLEKMDAIDRVLRPIVMELGDGSVGAQVENLSGDEGD
jgi:hypothetical protein